MPLDFQSVRKLEKILFPKIFFRKVIMLQEQMEKVTGTICNAPVDNIDVTNLLARTADSNRLMILVIVKLKRKLESCVCVLFKRVRLDFLHSVLSYLEQNKEFYKDDIIRSDLAKVIPQVYSKTDGLGRQSEGISDEALT